MKTITDERDQARYYLDQAATIILTLNREGQITYANQYLCDLTGYTRAELIGQNWFQLCLTEENRDRVFRAFQAVMSGDQEPHEYYENTIISKDGRRVLVAWHNRYNRDVKTGEILGAFSSGQDITLQRKFEDDLHANEIRYRQMFYNNTAAQIVIDPQTGAIIDANQSACEFYGYDYDTLTNVNINNINIASTNQRYEDTITDVSEHRVYNHQHRLASGEIRDVEMYVGPITIENTTLQLSVILDVTERERAKRELQLRESQFRTAISHFPGGMIMFDLQMRGIIARGQLHHNALGDLSDLEGALIPQVVPETVWDNLHEMYQAALQGHASKNDFEHDDRYFIEQVEPLYDQYQTIIGGLHLVQDITYIRESEQVLQDTKAQLYTILDGIVDGVAIISPDEDLLYANDTAAQILGYDSAHEMIRMTQHELVVPRKSFDEDGNPLPFEQQAVFYAINGQHPASQVMIFQDVTTDERVWVEIKAKPIFNDDGFVRFAVIILTDITRAREIEQIQLRTLQEKTQIEILQKYIANITHDLAQPLSVINTAIYMLERTTSDTAITKRTTTIAKQVSRIESILKDIKEISTLDTLRSLHTMPLDLAELFDEVIAQNETDLQAQGVTFEVDLQDLDQPVSGNASYMIRAINEVVQNAIDYSGEGGHIKLSANMTDNYFMIRIEDNGIGIPADALPRIMHRFYRVDNSRTMGPRAGTGLGLAIVKRIIELHQGDVFIKSEEGVGTRVHLRLPRSLKV